MSWRRRPLPWLLLSYSLPWRDDAGSATPQSLTDGVDAVLVEHLQADLLQISARLSALEARCVHDVQTVEARLSAKLDLLLYISVAKSSASPINAVV